MSRLPIPVLFAATTFVMGFIASAPASAAGPACRPAVVATASGLGVLGRGERRARIKTQMNWQQKVTDLYGDRYSRFATARAVNWSCRGGTIAPATCRLSARPCRV